MQKANKNFRLETVMEALSVSTRGLSRESGVDHTLISRWHQGTRPLTRRSTQLVPLAEAILRLDTEGTLAPLLAPYRQKDETALEALCEYLTGKDLPGLAPRTQTSHPRQTGAYVKEVAVYLGYTGFRRAALDMLDYLRILPPGRQVTVLCQGRYDWLTGNLPFVMQFIAKLRSALRRDAQLLVINRRGYSIAETAAFAGPWLLAHLHGYIRSRYYDGELPQDMRFVASIPGYWSGHAEEDAEAEDNLCVTLYTDPRDIRRDEAICARYLEESRPASQYGFLQSPEGGDENTRLWKEGPLPSWKDGRAPDGSFFAMCRVPGFGMMTRGEVATVCGEDALPPLPDYLFTRTEAFAPGPHRVILCREDVRDGFIKARRMHEPLTALLGRRAFVPRDMLAAQTKRLLRAMAEREDFEVALMPRVAFEKLQMELICWRDSVSVGWLQSMENSVFADDQATSGSFYGAIGYTWDKLLAGWKRKSAVRRQLNKWLAGRELSSGADSPIVKGWDVMPRE